MREILFRGKRIDNGEWEYGFYAEGTHFCGDAGKGKTYILDVDAPMFSEVIPSTVDQYTEIRDANNTKIFEGDIVRVLRNDDVLVVSYEYEEGAYMMNNDDYVASFLDNYWGRDVEVIGNIYDNPDLLN